VIDMKNACTVANDRMVIAKVELTFARNFNMLAGDPTTYFSFDLPANPAGNYIEFTNFTYGSAPPIMYDYTNGKRYVCDVSTPGVVKVELGPSATTRKLLFFSQNA